jgi:hypothetical protein
MIVLSLGRMSNLGNEKSNSFITNCHGCQCHGIHSFESSMTCSELVPNS